MGQFGPLWASRIWEAASRQYSDSNDSWLLSQDLVRTQPHGCAFRAPQPAAGAGICTVLCATAAGLLPASVRSLGRSWGLLCGGLSWRPLLSSPAPRPENCLPGLPGVPALSPCLREPAELSLPRLPQPSLGTLQASPGQSRSRGARRSELAVLPCPQPASSRSCSPAVSGKKEARSLALCAGWKQESPCLHLLFPCFCPGSGRWDVKPTSPTSVLYSPPSVLPSVPVTKDGGTGTRGSVSRASGS